MSDSTLSGQICLIYDGENNLAYPTTSDKAVYCDDGSSTLLNNKLSSIDTNITTNASNISSLGSSLQTITVTLSKDSWNMSMEMNEVTGETMIFYSQNVSVPGVTKEQSFDAPYIEPIEDMTAIETAYNKSVLSLINGGGIVYDGSVTLICLNGKPDSDITVKMNGNLNKDGKIAAPYQDISPILLWTNSDPTASFAAQTINLKLYHYTLVGCNFWSLPTSDEYVFAQGIKGVKNKSGFIGSTPIYRDWTATDTGVTFETGYNGTTANAQCCIPTAIYGIK